MLVIRAEQLKALGEALRARFQDRAVAHVQRAWPHAFKALGAVKVRESVRLGIDKARGYGFTTASDMLGYIDLMYSLGLTFDVDPQKPWVGELLHDEHLSPSVRMERLTERARGTQRSDG